VFFVLVSNNAFSLLFYLVNAVVLIVHFLPVPHDAHLFLAGFITTNTNMLFRHNSVFEETPNLRIAYSAVRTG